MDCFVGLYGCMFIVGVLGNGCLGLTLGCGPGAKTRSPLLYGLVIADLMVCCMSGPITATQYMFPFNSQPWAHIACFLQGWPVSASTLSMMAISVDRFLTIKNFRPTGPVARRRFVLIMVSIATWILAAILTGTKLLPLYPWQRSIIIARLIMIHILPACAVLVSHVGVYSKLTALSLTARAQHGELPLPMPLLKRPTHVIIITGVAMPGRDLPPEEAEGPAEQPSSLQSRRRLAHSLIWVAIIFILCWLPHVVCQFLKELGPPPPGHLENYSLLLGHVHSAISPILYWFINHPKKENPCNFHFPRRLYRSASSTNEAALGPFNPKLVRPPQNRRRSSNCLY